MRGTQPAAGVLMLLVLGSTVAAQGPKPEPEPPKLPPEIERVLALALAAPPEFAASALLRVESKVPGKDLRRELVDMAFSLASKARNPVQLDPVPGLDPDTRTGFLANALKLKLDSTSLQSRAVVAALAFDPVHARDLFAHMAMPPSGAAVCEDSLLPDVASYYDTLAAVIRSGFSPEERATELHVSFLVAALNLNSGVRDL